MLRCAVLWQLFNADLDYVAAHHGMEYAPVLFPGFSWTNMHNNKTSKDPPAPRFAYPEGGVFNVVPRMGGRFWLNQARWWTRNRTATQKQPVRAVDGPLIIL